jgi:hypothetical protein
MDKWEGRWMEEGLMGWMDGRSGLKVREKKKNELVCFVKVP